MGQLKTIRVFRAGQGNIVINATDRRPTDKDPQAEPITQPAGTPAGHKGGKG